MAPNGGPSMTSQARAAELNAAAAARARILNGELSEFRPRSSPSQFSSSHTNNAEHVAVESFRRPNRPVDRYYPPFCAPPTAATVYSYPQPQYVDSRTAPAVYTPAPYPVVTEYYQPVYQPIQSYQQVYPSYVNGYTPPAGPFTRGQIIAMERAAASRSAATPTPTKPGLPGPVQLAATPPVQPQRGPSPAKSPTKSRSRSPVKKLSATPSPRKPPVEGPRFFTPDDLSPLKIEVELRRFKAEQEKIVPPKDEEKPDGTEHEISPEKSPAKAANGHEADSDDHKGKDSEMDDEDEQLTPRAKQPGPSNVLPSLNNQSAMEARPETRRQPLTLEDSPLAQKSYRKSMVKVIQPYSFLPPGFMPGSDVKIDVGTANLQRMLRVEEAQSTKPGKSMYQTVDGLFNVAQKHDEAAGDVTPKAVPRRLRSPFQLRPRSPVVFYEPIVNKYARDVFASRHSRLEELWKVETAQSWQAFRQKPEVKHLPGPFKGFPRFPLVDEDARRLMTTGHLMPPPGFAVPGPILLSRSAHWNPESRSSNRATTYYDRVLAAEDWFHQSVLKKNESSNKFQKKINEVQSMILNRNDMFSNLPLSSRDLKAVQVTELIKRVSENLISYTDTAESEKRGFEFCDTELDLENGLGRSKRTRRRPRRARRRRGYGSEFGIAPGSELFDGVVVGSELSGSSDS